MPCTPSTSETKYPRLSKLHALYPQYLWNQVPRTLETMDPVLSEPVTIYPKLETVYPVP